MKHDMDAYRSDGLKVTDVRGKCGWDVTTRRDSLEAHVDVNGVVVPGQILIAKEYGAAARTRIGCWLW